jgi:hypothetical protein
MTTPPAEAGLDPAIRSTATSPSTESGLSGVDTGSIDGFFAAAFQDEALLLFA